MDELKELLSLCKCEVSINVNAHRCVYISVSDYIKEIPFEENLIEQIGEDVYKLMIEKDTIIEIQCYVDTPVGFFKIYHYDIELAINKMIEIIKKDTCKLVFFRRKTFAR